VKDRTQRRVSVSLADLADALTWRTEEGGYYLDLETGEVAAWSPEWDARPAEEIDHAVDEGRLLWIDPIESRVEFGWMEEFLSTVRKGQLRERLAAALRGRQPFRRFKDTLVGFAAERERWFAFHRERALEVAKEWLEENGLETTSKPAQRKNRGPQRL